MLYLFGKFSLSTDYFTFLHMNGNSLCTSATYPSRVGGADGCAQARRKTPLGVRHDQGLTLIPLKCQCDYKSKLLKTYALSMEDKMAAGVFEHARNYG